MPIDIEGTPTAMIKEDEGELSALSVALEAPSGRRATVIGTIHLASQSFFRRIEQLMHETPGIVLSEGLLCDERSLQDGGSLKKLFNFNIGTARTMARVSQELGLDLAVQRDTLRYPQGRTQNSDVTLRRLYRALVERGFDFSEMDATIAVQNELEWLCTAGPEIKDQSELAMQVETDYCGEYLGAENEPKRYARPWEDVMDQVRFSKVVRNILEYSKDDNVIVPWETQSLRTIIPSLQSRDWKMIPESVRYMPFYTRRFT